MKEVFPKGKFCCVEHKQDETTAKLANVLPLLSSRSIHSDGSPHAISMCFKVSSKFQLSPAWGNK